MGFQDRDYNRYEPYDDYGYRHRRSGGGMSMTMRIVIVNFVLWLANGLLFSNNVLSEIMAIIPGTLEKPELWWKFLTYGFAHSPNDFWHIAGNMFGLVMFGYGMMLGIGPGGFGLVRGENIEDRLGRGEYLTFYLLTIIVSGIVYSIVNRESGCLGASGGVTGVIILYAFFYPTKTLMLYGILPLPMWAIGAFLVFMDARGASGIGEGGIAYTAHLAGAGFAVIYYFLFVQRGRGITDIFTGWKKLFKRKPKLHIYKNDDPPKRAADSAKSAKDEEFEKRLDEILDRYGKVGEAGLTNEERDFLQRASKKYRNR